MKRAILFFAILLTACGAKNLKVANDLRYIDVAGGVGKSRTFNLSEIADSIMSAFDFISFTKENSVSNKLKSMAEKLKETDNHILVKVKLKSL